MMIEIGKSIVKRHTNSRGSAFLLPLLPLAVAFAAGVLLSQWCALPLYIPIVVVVVCAGTAFPGLKRQINAIPTILVALSFFFSGAALASLEPQAVSTNRVKRLIEEGVLPVGMPLEITGVLEREPEIAPERIYLSLKVEGITANRVERQASGVVTLLAISGESAAGQLAQLELRYGARIRVMTTLERTDSFRNPGVSSFTEYLDRKGYDANGFVKSLLLMERLDDQRVFLPLAWLYEWRRKLHMEINARFSEETSGVLAAALLGNRYNLSHATAERFRDGGTFHVLVISGLHITFLGGLVFLIMRRITNNRLAQFLASVSVLWAYSLAVGGEPSVMRAAVMFSVVMLAPLVSRRASSLNALGAVTIALLVWRPSDLLDPSFQLTFVSVLAILVLAWPLLQKMSEIGSWRPTRETPYPPSCSDWVRSLSESLFWSDREGERHLELTNYSYRLFKTPVASTLERLRVQRMLRYTFAAIVVSVSVQISLLPFLVIYFHRLSLASLVLNIGVSLLMAGVALAALAAIAIAQISSTLAMPLVEATNALNWLMVHSVDPFARAGVASIRLPEYTGWAAAFYLIYYVPLVAIAIWLASWKPLEVHKVAITKNKYAAQLTILGLLFAVTFIVVHPGSARHREGRLRIDFLDVGQGDSAVVTFPDSTTLLIDGGGRPGPFKRSVEGVGTTSLERETRSIGESVVSEYLWWRGLDRVDYMVATHADADHIDGLNDVARNFAVRAALVARTPEGDPEYARFSQTLTSRGIPVRLVGAGDVLGIGDAAIKVLWPPASTNPDSPSRNNDSLVLHLQFGNCSVLLTSDIEMPGENAVLETHNSLKADIVKVAHHGSRTSSIEQFIAAAKPHFAIISVGQSSMFGHPHAEVVERWNASGARVLTTGRRGTITFSTDGQDWHLKTFVNEE
jgi:competence protein ComEC